MSMDGRFILKLGQELNRELADGRINKIYQLSRTDFLFVVHQNGISKQWFLSLSLQHARTHLSWNSYDKPASPTGFCMLLRKYLEGGIIRAVESLNRDRILRATIENRNDFGEKVSFFLMAELMGKYANLILTSPDGIIIDCYKHVSPFEGQQRSFLKGLPYELPLDGKIDPTDLPSVESFLAQTPELTEKSLVDGIRGLSVLSAGFFLSTLFNHTLAPLETFLRVIDHAVEPTSAVLNGKTKFYFFDVFPEVNKKTYPSLSRLLDDVFFEAGQLERTRQVSKNIVQLVKRELDRNKDKLEKLSTELEEAKNNDILRVYGDMIRQYQESLKKGDDVLKAFCYELNRDVIIPLDRLLTPNQNAMAFFRRYKKARQAVGHIENQIALAKQEIAYFDLLTTQLETASLHDLIEIAEELKTNRYLAAKPLKTQPKRPNFDIYVDDQNIEIVVGKNNLQNDFITHQLAKANEWWFHTKDIPGSHVLVRATGELTEGTIRAAANLAASHSKARFSSSVPVDYTLVKNVKKIPGVAGSFVTISHQKTIFIDPDRAKIDAMDKKK